VPGRQGWGKDAGVLKQCYLLCLCTLQIYSYTGPVAVSKNTLIPTLIQVSRKHCVVLLVVSAGAGAWYEDPVCSPGGHSPAA